MDYTFGFDAKELARYGAKAVVFDAIRENFRNVNIHPYVKVSPRTDPEEAQTEACRASNATCFVVRASSRYEFLPGTSGMTKSERFVHWSEIGEKIQQVGKPTVAYKMFVEENGLEPEKRIPVIVQPMLAGSFGVVTKHPNRNMTMVDYFKDIDDENTFRERSSVAGWSDAVKKAEKMLARVSSFNSCVLLKGTDKFYARYEEDGSVKGETGEYRHLMDLACQLFEPLNLFGDGYAHQGEFGPDRKTAEPVLYQLKPFMPKRKAGFRMKKTDADMVFGICRSLELPVVKIKGVRYVLADDFDEVGDSPTIRQAKQLFNLSLGTERKIELANVYQILAAKKAREQHSGNVCLAMESYYQEDQPNFLNALKPAVVVIGDEFRAGMIHSRTNLIQTTPVAIFGNDLYFSDADKVRISCDGKNAVVEEL